MVINVIEAANVPLSIQKKVTVHYSIQNLTKNARMVIIVNIYPIVDMIIHLQRWTNQRQPLQNLY